jgi:hypothetical protein
MAQLFVYNGIRLSLVHHHNVRQATGDHDICYSSPYFDCRHRDSRHKEEKDRRAFVAPKNFITREEGFSTACLVEKDFGRRASLGGARLESP